MLRQYRLFSNSVHKETHHYYSRFYDSAGNSRQVYDVQCIWNMKLTTRLINSSAFSSILQVQQLVSEGLLFRWLGVKFSRTSTPFLGSVILGSLTATLATLGDVSWLLVTGAGGKIAFDLTICTSSLLVHYGVGLPQCSTSPSEAEESSANRGGGLASAGSKATGRRRRLQRRRRKRHKWVTFSPPPF